MSKFHWNPETGARVKFENDETPPANFLPCHPNDPARDAKVGKQPKAVPNNPDRDEDQSGGMTKAQIAEALTAGRIEFNPADNKATLCAALIGALKKVLAGREIEFREDESAAELLAKVQTQPQA